MTIAIIDAETDPFKFGRVPEPFCWGFFDGKNYKEFWRDDYGIDCTSALLEYLESITEPLTIYAHNGGKFDFLFFIQKFSGKIKIVNGRILEARFGIHTFRDSYSILPISLDSSGAGKMKIDYKTFELEHREKFKEEILTYLKQDCVSLFNLVTAFRDEFGDVLTIGSAAMRELKKFHKFETLNKNLDKSYREYYFGGRCQCFQTGIIEGPIVVHDVNSMYPSTMKRTNHPIGKYASYEKKISQNTFFVKWEGKNFNAVPMRNFKTKGLDFNIEYGIFYTSIHEFNAALEYGVIEPKRIISTIDFKQFITFADFVDHFYSSRKIAQKNGDAFLELFYKLILNSAYGKFAQDSSDFVDSIILPWGEVPDNEEYFLEYRHDAYAIWSKPALRESFFNVATAASITGGSRAIMLGGIVNSTNPLYCDTDAIFSFGLDKVEIHDTNLGAWKFEKSGDCIAIAGKKMYALMSGDKCVKMAAKGVRIPSLAVFDMCRGETIETRNDAPSFKLGIPKSNKNRVKFEHTFIERKIKSTNLVESI